MKRTNANYEIIKSITIHDREIVLGENKNFEVSPYVTWIHDGEAYYWGHYLSNYDDAIMDFVTRVIDECKYVARELQNITKQKGDK